MKNYIQIFQRKGKKKCLLAEHAGVFCQNLGIIAYTLEDYSNFKSIFSFNNASIFEIHDYFRTRGNAGFNDLSQLLTTLSNQDFTVFDKFRLRESLRKMNEMHHILLNIWLYPHSRFLAEKTDKRK